MHELSICEGMVQLLEEQAEVQGFAHVQALWLEIGRLSCIEIEALRFSFESVARDSIAEGALLHIEQVPGKAECSECKASFEVEERYAQCPECDSFRLNIVGGEELRIKELEVI